MKLSELLAQHPTLDVDLAISDGEVVIDAMYLLRLTRMDIGPADSGFAFYSTDHTDEIVEFGMLELGKKILDARIPVHICGEHD